MPIILDATSVSANVSASSVTWPHTCSADTKILVVCIKIYDSVLGDRIVSSVRYNGDDLINSGYIIDVPVKGVRAEIWYRVNPDTGGAYNIVVTMGGKCSELIASAISLEGVDTANPIDSGNSGYEGLDPNPTLTITTQTVDTWLIDSMIMTYRSLSGGPDYNQIHFTDIGSYICGSQYRSSTGAAGDYDISWTIGQNATWAMSAVAIKAAVPPAAGRSFGYIF